MYIREILLLILGALFSQQFTWTFLSTVYQKHLVLKRKDIFEQLSLCSIMTLAPKALSIFSVWSLDASVSTTVVLPLAFNPPKSMADFT